MSGRSLSMEGKGELLLNALCHYLKACSFAEVKRQLLALKKELKCWEAMFERKHGRKPDRVRPVML